MKDYLTRPLAERLARFKANPAKGIPELRQTAGNAGAPFKVGGYTMRWYEDTSFARSVRLAHEVVKLRHTGWYLDNFQEELARGVVLTLSHGRFMAGITTTYDSSSAAMVENCIYDDERSAASAADAMAQRYAEDAKSQAEIQIENRHEEITAIRAKVCQLAQGIRNCGPLVPIVCEQLRMDIRRLLADKTRAFKRIAKMKSNYWLAVE
jgi:hypothetical protein